MAWTQVAYVAHAEQVPTNPFTIATGYDGGALSVVERFGGGWVRGVEVAFDNAGVVPDPGPTCEEIGLAVWSYGDRTLTP